MLTQGGNHRSSSPEYAKGSPGSFVAGIADPVRLTTYRLASRDIPLIVR